MNTSPSYLVARYVRAKRENFTIRPLISLNPILTQSEKRIASARTVPHVNAQATVYTIKNVLFYAMNFQTTQNDITLIGEMLVSPRMGNKQHPYQ